jgi:tripartite-type tricarboxylate transporter receptor subunit TctC
VGCVNLLDQAGLDVTYVPYPSTGNSIADFIGGHVDVLVASVSSVKPLIPDKAVPVVNTANMAIDKKKFPEFKGIPNATDLGYEGLTFPRWVGVHPDTPDEIADEISKKMDVLLKLKSVQRLISRMGEEIIFIPREQAVKEYDKTIRIMTKAVQILKPK